MGQIAYSITMDDIYSSIDVARVWNFFALWLFLGAENFLCLDGLRGWAGRRVIGSLYDRPPLVLGIHQGGLACFQLICNPPTFIARILM